MSDKCSCGNVYIGQMRRAVAIREQEHKCHLRQGNIDKAVVAQHGWDTGPEILLGDTARLHKSSKWHERVTRESVEINLLKECTLIQDEGVFLSQAWLPTLSLCKNLEPPLRRGSGVLVC